MQYISILRGINVGGKRKLLMADLKVCYTKLGFKNIVTYIQSGNVIFESDENNDELSLSKNIENAIKDTFAYDVPVIVRTVNDLELIIRENPYIQSETYDIERLHLTFLADNPDEKLKQSIKTMDYEPDGFTIKENNAYVFCSGKYSDSKLNNQFFEKKLKVQATTRNWKTVLKLYELATKTV